MLIVDEETSERYATIRVALKKAGIPVTANDIWIAASAMQHGLPILTSDRDFQNISQVIVRHFSPRLARYCPLVFSCPLLCPHVSFQLS